MIYIYNMAGRGIKRSRSREEGDRKKVRMEEPLTMKIEELDHSRIKINSRINLKNIICKQVDQILSPAEKHRERLEIIHNYLETVKRSNEHLQNNNILPSIEEILNDLTMGLKSLLNFNGRLVGTPSLSKKELTYLYLTPEKAKFNQIKKDDWLNRLVENTPANTPEQNKNILEWLSEMKIDDEEPPLTPIPYEAREHGNEWRDLSLIYSDAIDVLRSKENEHGVTELMKALPQSIPTTYIQINVGKLSDHINNLRKTLTGIEYKLNKFMKILKKFILGSIRIGILIFGTFIKISAVFIANLLISFIKKKTNNRFRDLFSRVVEGIIDAPFVISDDNIELQREIDDKYKLFLTGIVIKTLFMLGIIDEPQDLELTPENIEVILTKGLKRLSLYNNGKLAEGMGEYKVSADQIMRYMNEYTEWYLLRKTTIFLNTNNGAVDNPENPKLLLLEDRIEPRLMDLNQIASAQGFGPFAPQPLVPDHDNELDDRNVPMDVDPTGRSKKKKKNTKKRKRKSNTKNRKRKSNTNKRKKIKKKTKQKK